MKFGSKLWMLAVAMATVGCSDELEDGPNTQGGEQTINGPTTYMNVNVSTNVVTKAPQGTEGNPSGGEDGDGLELGENYEYKVNDVTVVLFRNADNSSVSPINASSVLVASGYSTVNNNMEPSDEPQHDRMVTVTLNVTDVAEDFDGRTYGVIAITNLNSDGFAKRINQTDINTGAELANYLQKTAWTGSGSDADHFIMSSHLPTVETVTLDAGATEQTAPTTYVHVERLAAKIRINEYKGADGNTPNNFIYEIMEGNNSVAKVRLDEVAIVNQLTSGTYMLKHMSTTIAQNGEIPDATNDTYLANEIWGKNEASNYVIDPWTRNKVANSVSSTNSITAATGIMLPTGDNASTLSYTNPFKGTNYAEMWNSLTGKVTLSGNELLETSSQLHLAYVQENTTSAANSLNGYSTGAIFRATYFPAKVSAIGTDSDAGKIVSKNVTGYDDFGESSEDTSDGSGDGGDDATASRTTTTETLPTFYVLDNVAYETLETIWAEYVWGKLTDEERKSIDYTSFNSSGITSLDAGTFMNSTLAKSSDDDPFGYVAYLKNKVNTTDQSGTPSYSWKTSLTTSDAFSNYIATETGKAAYVANGVKEFKNGECYYPFWIRHANNDEAAMMGIMEFGIVRNNIYDLTVQGIEDFGLAGTDVPNPGEEDESDNFFMKVVLYVRNWVVRTNDGIIL